MYLLKKLKEYDIHAHLRSDYEFRETSLKLVLWSKELKSTIWEFCKLFPEQEKF